MIYIKGHDSSVLHNLGYQQAIDSSLTGS